MGKHLSDGEVLDALDVGNVNENKLVTMPHSKISYKLTQLTNVSSQYDTYISKIKRVSMKLLKRSIARKSNWRFSMMFSEYKQLNELEDVYDTEKTSRSSVTKTK